MDSIKWLLDSDPAIRWQVMRDVTDAPAAALAAERARVSQEGIGAAILAGQEPDGAWRRAGAPTWLMTLFTMQLLRATGVDRTDPNVESAVARAEANLQWNVHENRWDLRSPEFGGNPFFLGEEEPCINGGVLALGGYFGRPNEELAGRLLSEQLEDGGWNCEAPKSRRSSFHTTICVLEGLLEYERAAGGAPEIAEARRRGGQYLLARGLFRRLSNGEVVNPAFLSFGYPPRYEYDVLRALDYLRSAGATLEPRMKEAVEVVRNRREMDGRWVLDRSHPEAIAVSLGEGVGEPSRWNTLRALRVLRWFQGQSITAATSSAFRDAADE